MGTVLHTIAAFSITIGILVHPLLAIPGFLALGFFWEKTQHRYYWFVQNGKLSRTSNGWFGWITKHRVIEGAGWPIGALIGSAIWMIII